MKKIILFIMLTACVYAHAKDAEQVTYIPRDERGYPCVMSVKDACAAYPKTIQEVQERSALAQKEALKLVTGIIACSTEQQNKETVLYALDRAYAWLDSTRYTINTMGEVHPDAAMRKECAAQYLVLNNFVTEQLESNKSLYQVFKNYHDTNAKTEEYTAEETYFLNKIISSFERAGLGLSDEKIAQLVALKKRSTELEATFLKNIREDSSKISVPKEGLAGVPEDFIAALPRDGELCIITANFASVVAVLRTCEVEETRKALHSAYFDRAYPVNVPVLKELIAVRDEYARLLGYESYAHYDLEPQMIKTPERAWNFLNDLQAQKLPLAEKQVALLTENLPVGVSLTEDGKIKSYDVPYVRAYYNRTRYAVDQNAIAEYFPMEKTIDGLIEIYQQFFDIIIEKVSVKDMWHPDVRLVRISSKDKKILGYVFLDLFPRAKKHSNAGQFYGADGIKKVDSVDYPATVTVVCNFTRPVAEKPALLKYGEVTTFFHEFGHALHTLFGRAPLFYQSGTKKIQNDFPEMPSQLLEKWLESPDILKMVSCHYKTEQPLSDELIANVLAASRDELQQPYRLLLAMLLLTLFEEGQHEDIEQRAEKLRAEIFPYFQQGGNFHHYCSLVHTAQINYGPKYYTYLLTEVLSEPVFEKIKKEGLLNPIAGKKYVDAILSRGGSKDANDMLRDYLGTGQDTIGRLIDHQDRRASDKNIVDRFSHAQCEDFVPTSGPVQLYLSMFLLRVFGEGSDDERKGVLREIQQENNPRRINFASEDHRHRYYAYLWARVLVRAFLEKIEKEGLLSTEQGQQYIAAVLSCGSSEAGVQMVIDYVGNEPSIDAFYKKMGF